MLSAAGARRLAPPQRTATARVMYSTRGISAVASVTELRSNTTELIEQARQQEDAILVQKNNDPYAVLLSYERYVALLDGQKGKK